MKKITKQLFLLFMLLCLSLPTLAEETYSILPWKKLLQEPQQFPQVRNRGQISLDFQMNEPGIPRAVEAIERLTRSSSNREYQLPGTPGEAMEMLDELAIELDGLSVAVTSFRHSRSTLLTSIDRLGRNADRNRSFLVRWTPILLGNLRLMNQRSMGNGEDMWLLVAMVVLERQVSTLGLRMRQTNTSELMIRNLNARENEIEVQREQLFEALADIRVQLRQIRREANTRDQS